MSVLKLVGATLSLGGKVVLKNLDFAIGEGVFVGMLGPNGAGKTTLMRAILGLVKPQSGRIEVFGRPARRGQAEIGYMPQAAGSLGDVRLSGRDFVAAAAGGIGWGLPRLTPAQRDDVDRVIALVDAERYAARPVNALSGGERQRLLLAQSLLGKPRLLLLDEPLSFLDPHHQAAAIELVRGLQQRLGIAVILSGHELNPLLPALDQVLYLGRQQAALGSVGEVVTAPVLSRLYGAPIEVLHVNSRIFVMAGGVDVERNCHVHL